MLKAFLISFLLASTCFATSAVHDSKYFQIAKVHVRQLSAPSAMAQGMRPQFFQGSTAIGSSLCRAENRIQFMSPETGSLEAVNPVDAATGVAELESIEKGLDVIINMGKKVWSIVDAGKPKVDLQSDIATALPTAIGGCWLDLQGWKAPVTTTWEISLENLYGMEVVRFVYRVVLLSGGSYNGIGKYIGYAAMQPVELSVAWGYTFNATASVPAVYNIGSKEHPVAAMNILVDWTVTTLLKHQRETQSYYLTGYGTIRQL